MRPINLIPEDERRRGSRGGAPAPGSPLAYLIVGALAIGLIGVVMYVLTSNTISDRESEVAGLQAEKAAATAKAEKLTPYASFQAVAEQRTSTIAELADSRFDWVRVIKQLALTLPSNVYFTSLSGSAGGGEGGSEGISGPSLTIAGCAPGQNAVAGFVASLKEIDGVTRVEAQAVPGGRRRRRRRDDRGQLLLGRPQSPVRDHRRLRRSPALARLHRRAGGSGRSRKLDRKLRIRRRR
ncbi:MAG: hypothetical protein QM729_04645 [Solirubrobacterales bacterium]